jgi:5,10-methylenetetrahydromethanopterin reductase
MRFGLSIMQTTETMADIPRLASKAEQAGFDLIGIPDSHSVWREPWVALAVAAGATSRAAIGPMVTNPLTRHPTVTASAIASLHELTGGRVFLGMGTGNSVVHNIGLPPARLADMEQSITIIRDCLSGDHDDNARTAMLNWSDRKDVPIIVSASGPKAIRSAARTADAVIFEIGRDPRIVAKAVALAWSEREQGPRAGEPMEMWLLGKGYVADDPAEARAAVATIMATSANGLQAATDWKEVPDEYREPLREMHARYAFSKHASTNATDTSNVELMDELGLTEFIYSRFGILGNAQQVTNELSALAEIGIDGVSFSGAIADKETFIQRMADGVIPNLATPTPTTH